jgi:hypothetical protein
MHEIETDGSNRRIRTYNSSITSIGGRPSEMPRSINWPSVKKSASSVADWFKLGRSGTLPPAEKSGIARAGDVVDGAPETAVKSKSVSCSDDSCRGVGSASASVPSVLVTSLR